MEEQKPEKEISYSSWLESIFKPGYISSLRKKITDGILHITLHESATEKREVELRSMYPFMTLYDVKLALYEALGRSEESAPECTFLSYGTTPLDFQWVLPGSKEPFRARPPFKVAMGQTPDYSEFVDANGSRKLMGLVQRDRVLLEDLFADREIPKFDAYTLKSLAAAIPGEKPIGERLWNARLYPYFPYLAVGQEVPNESQKKRLTAFTDAFLSRRNFFDRVEMFLRREQRVAQPEIDKVRSLRIVWPKETKTEGMEMLFYTLPVTEKRPYMCLLPTEGSKLTKIHLLEDQTPDIYDHSLLLQWAKQKNPTKQTNDYTDTILSKFKYRRSEGVQPALYGTLRLFERGTADVIVEPPQGLDELLPGDHLFDLPNILEEIVGDIAHLKDSSPTLGPSDFEFTIEIPRTRRAITTSVFDTILSPFSAFFQEIPAVPGTKPLATLRYKMVSNYVTEKRIFTYLTQLIARKYSKGEADENDLWRAVAEEFQLPEDEARAKVRDRLKAQGEVDMVDPEQNIFGPKYNPGIDITILAKHPMYIVSVYRVQSIQALQRIVALLSLMFSVNPEELGISRAAKAAFVKTQAAATVAAEAAAADAAAEREFEEVEEAGEAAPAAPAATVENTNERAAELAAAMGDFEDFDEMDVPSAVPAPPVGAVAAAVPEEEERELGFLGDLEDDGFEEVAEQNAEVAVAAAEKVVPPPQPEAPAAAASGAAAPPPAEGAAARFRQEFAAEEQRAKAIAPAVRAAPPPQVANENEEKEIQPTTKESIANYFITKLKEADRRLFDYNKAYKDAPKYVSQCQPTYGRQPAVMNERRFRLMKEEYARDGVVFIVYPLDSLDEIGDIKGLEVYRVLRYGTSAQKQNYYICSRYFCVYDEIMIREADLESTKMRKPKVDEDGEPVRDAEGNIVYRDKLAGECPFCRGKVIRNKNNPGPDERILERAVKPETGKRHEYPYPLKKPNPEGWHLPCCFSEDDVKEALYSRPAWNKYRELGIPHRLETGGPVASGAAGSGPAAPVAEQPQGQQLTVAGRKIQTYAYTLMDVVKKDTYIVGQEKMPLDFSVAERGVVKPQIGLLPNALNPYFKQDPTTLTSSIFNPTRLKEGAAGFFRVAVDNTLPRADSFLAAVAPFYTNYGVNSAADLKTRILENLSLKIFLTMNYGNLAIEFFNASESLKAKGQRGVDPTAEELEASGWDEQLGIKITEENYPAVLRAVQSYLVFTEWLQSTTTKKEYRQFAHFFAQPNLLRKDPSAVKTGGLITRGITFIVLDIHQDGQVDVRCPPYGYNMELYAKNDIGFLLHHWTGIWEPIFHADSRADKRETTNVYDLLFNPEYKEVWPDVVLDRVREFQGKCSGPGRAVYTSMRGINPNTLIPLSLIRTVRGKGYTLEGIIRDAYNHVVAAVFEIDGGKAIVPISDDGSQATELTFYMDWDDVKPAPADKVLAFYESILLPKFPLYPKYQVSRFRTVDGGIAYLRLQNGLLVPVTKASSEEQEAKIRMSLAPEAPQKDDKPEWDINYKIVFDQPGAEEDALRAYRMKAKEFQEIYEHLRLTFARHLSAQENGGVLRKRLESVIFTRHLPLFEKRKRLKIFLQGEVAEWLTSEAPTKVSTRSPLLRVDCTLIDDEDSCNGRCVWRPRGDGGQCLLHHPTTIPVAEAGAPNRNVDAFEVLLYRLIEELLRFGERRRQLFENDISRIIPITEPVKDGNQIIYPESSIAWSELLQRDWSAKGDEEKLFLEEKGREAGEEDVVPLTPETRLPETLITALGGSEDPRIGGLRILRLPLLAFFSVLGFSARAIFGSNIEVSGPLFTKEQLQKVADVSLRPIFQIDLRGDSIEILEALPVKKQKTVLAGIPIIVALEDGTTAIVLPNPDQPQFPSFAQLPVALVNKVVAALR